VNIPGFSAAASLYQTSGWYLQGGAAQPSGGNVVPAIPFCGNCDFILDNCERNGWRPRAVCNACAVGDCFSGVERPPWLLNSF
jgi:hypothetical protein